jgi:hypothetical protein
VLTNDEERGSQSTWRRCRSYSARRTEYVRARLDKRHADAIKTPATRFRLRTSCFRRFSQLQPRLARGFSRRTAASSALTGGPTKASGGDRAGGMSQVQLI